MSLLIGVTTYGRNEDGKFELPGEYIDAVRRAGGVPVLLPPGDTQHDALFKQLDGLVLTGGGDIAPGEYGSPGHDTVYLVDPERDASELYLARKVVESQLPTFAICRGMQVINVAHGGTLHEHIPTEFGDRIAHRAPPRRPTPHEITVKPASRLRDITRESTFVCQSWHHQAIDTLAPSFTVVAEAADGVIEAVESDLNPWLICVQWHPELTAAEDPIQQRLFDAVVAYAKEKKSGV